MTISEISIQPQNTRRHDSVQNVRHLLRGGRIEVQMSNQAGQMLHMILQSSADHVVTQISVQHLYACILPRSSSANKHVS